MSRKKISKSDTEAFRRDGFLHLEGAVSESLCRDASAQVWDYLPGTSDCEDDWPEGTVQPRRTWFEDGPVWHVYEKVVGPIFDQFVGVGLHDRGWTLAEIACPIVVFPTRGAEEWKVHGSHVDLHGPIHRTLVMGALVYLHDIPKDAGATAVWPGEFRGLEDEALKANRLTCDILNRDRTFELQGGPAINDYSCGDVILLHRNTPHAGTMNKSVRPRLALQFHAHLNAEGEAHCRNKTGPRSVFESFYDRHFDEYFLYNYFGCRPKNQWDE